MQCFIACGDPCDLWDGWPPVSVREGKEIKRARGIRVSLVAEGMEPYGCAATVTAVRQPHVAIRQREIECCRVATQRRQHEPGGGHGRAAEHRENNCRRPRGGRYHNRLRDAPPGISGSRGGLLSAVLICSDCAIRIHLRARQKPTHGSRYQPWKALYVRQRMMHASPSLADT